MTNTENLTTTALASVAEVLSLLDAEAQDQREIARDLESRGATCSPEGEVERDRAEGAADALDAAGAMLVGRFATDAVAATPALPGAWMIYTTDASVVAHFAHAGDALEQARRCASKLGEAVRIADQDGWVATAHPR